MALPAILPFLGKMVSYYLMYMMGKEVLGKGYQGYRYLTGQPGEQEQMAQFQVQMAKQAQEAQRQGMRQTMEFLSEQQRSNQLMGILPAAMQAAAPLSGVTQAMTPPQMPAPTPPPGSGGMRFSEVLGLAG